MSSSVRYNVMISDFRILDINNEFVKGEKITYSKKVLLNNKEKADFNIVMKSDDKIKNSFSVDICCEKDLIEEEFINYSNNIITNLLNTIAFVNNFVRVGEARIVNKKFKKNNMATKNLKCRLNVKTDKRDKKILKKICNTIKYDNNYNKDEYNLFRAAMNNNDVVVKYMFLYQILLCEHKNSKNYESQKEVDKFIKSKFNQSKHNYQKWSDTNRKETIYTRLRNQVGHFRGKTSSETRNKMKSVINELIKLVKMSIKSN